MLGQPNLGLAQGSVFVAYKAEDGQKLRLGKDVLGELGAIVVGQDGLQRFAIRLGRVHHSGMNVYFWRRTLQCTSTYSTNLSTAERRK